MCCTASPPFSSVMSSSCVSPLHMPHAITAKGLVALRKIPTVGLAVTIALVHFVEEQGPKNQRQGLFGLFLRSCSPAVRSAQ